MHDWKEELKRASHELDIPPTEEGSVSIESEADLAEQYPLTQEELAKLEELLRQFEGDAHQEVVADDIQAGREGATPKEHVDVQKAGEEFEEGVRALAVASRKKMDRVSKKRGESVDDQDRGRGRKRERIISTEDVVVPKKPAIVEAVVSYPEDEEEKLESNPPKSIQSQLATRESGEVTRQIDRASVVATQKEPKEESLATPKLEEASQELTRGEFITQERGPRFESRNKELSRALVEAGIRVLNERGVALSTAEFVEAVERMTNLTVSPDDYYVLYNATRTEFFATKQKEEQPKEEPHSASDQIPLNEPPITRHEAYVPQSDKNDSITWILVEIGREQLFERITVFARRHPEVTNAVELINIFKAKNPEIAISDVQGLFYFAEQLIKDAKRHRGQTSGSVARPEWVRPPPEISGNTF